MAQIIFDHVTKKFKNETALHDISFEIDKGEFVFFIGKSGAGKSVAEPDHEAGGGDFREDHSGRPQGGYHDEE